METDPKDIVITPLRNTLPLAIDPASEMSDIARKQLESLNKSERKKRSLTSAEVSSSTEIKGTPSNSDSETVVVQSQVSAKAAELIIDGTSAKQMHNLSSSIISKAELENEIRQKVAKQEPKQESAAKKVVGTIEIPQDLILSGLNTTPTAKADKDDAVQLHDQELIDILEGKSGDETEMYEVIADNGNMVIVKDINEESGETMSYEIVTGDQTVTQAKAKLLEREIAMRQIASLPVRKNKRSYTAQVPPASSKTQHQTVAQSLAADWVEDEKDEEMILEVVNMEDDSGEPKIKILNMTILNESAEAKPKTLPPKAEPKILNKEAPKVAPKILNINASAAEAPATFKRTRIIKKKEIWDPSATSIAAAASSSEKKQTGIEKFPPLPPSITIKKLTKESISKPAVLVEKIAEEAPEPQPKPAPKKGKKRSEIDKLLQDEGAVNMIYSLERENNNEDVPEIEVKPDQKSLIDKSQEKTSLVTKAKAIKSVVMKQSASPPETKPAGRARAKREITPVKVEEEPTKLPVTKAQKPSNAGRKKKTDNSWDFMYSQAQATCDDAMIIRRHSNSSYSSSAASPRRLSVDVNDTLESPPSSAKKMKKDSNEAFEFTKPPQKNTKSPADNVLKKDFVEELRGKISTVITKNKEKTLPVTKGRKRAAATSTDNPATPAKRASRSNGSDQKEFRLVRNGGVAQIILNQNPLSISLLSEMKTVLNQLESDDCKVVLITSSEGFSEGLDYSTLVQSTVDKRKQAASDLVTALKNFLISLAAFPKLLVCGLEGLTSGIAVCMLPLFDIVFADPTVTLSLPHAKIGSNPEGISILKFSGKVNTNAVTRMFYLNETLSADVAQSTGLITKTIAEDFEKELMNFCTKVADLSSQALESTKSVLNEDFLSSIDAHLTKEVKILQQQWISAECQEKFKKHAIKGGEW